MRLISLALLAAIIPACHENGVLEPPPLADAASLVFAVEREGGAESVWVFDAAAPDYPALEYRDGLELAAGAYRCPPELLRLEPGLQTLVEPATIPRIPDPDLALTSAVTGDQQSPWRDDLPSPLLERALRRLDLPEEALCDAYSVEVQATDISHRETRTSSPAVFGVRLDDRELFVGTLAGQFFRVSANGEPIRLTRLSTTTPHYAAHRGADGEIWLFDGKLGAVARGHPDTSFEPVQARSFGKAFELVRADGATGPAPFEVFLASDARSFERFDGVQFTTLATAAPERDRTRRYNQAPSVVWLGPGRALAVNINPRGMLHRYQDGQVTLEAGPPELGRPGTIKRVEGYGVILGGESGRIAFLDDAGVTWSVFETNLDARARAFAPLAGNLLVAGVFANQTAFAQFQPGVGGCTQDYFAPGLVIDLIAFPGDAVLDLSAIGTDDDRDIVRMTRLEAPTPLPACLRPRERAFR